MWPRHPSRTARPPRTTPKRDRRFRPTRGTECLESRLLLDGSGFVGPIPPSYQSPPAPGSAPTDPTLVALMNQDQQAVQGAQIMTVIAVPGMERDSKNPEIKAINDARDQFNKSIDSVVAINAASIKTLTASVAALNGMIARLDITTPAGKALFVQILDIRTVANNGITASTAKISDLTKLKAKVNLELDQIIANITTKVYVMGDSTMTVFDSDAYQAWG